MDGLCRGKIADKYVQHQRNWPYRCISFCRFNDGRTGNWLIEIVYHQFCKDLLKDEVHLFWRVSKVRTACTLICGKKFPTCSGKESGSSGFVAHRKSDLSTARGRSPRQVVCLSVLAVNLWKRYSNASGIILARCWMDAGDVGTDGLSSKNP